MSNRPDHPDGSLSVEAALTQAELRQVLAQVAEQNGLRLTFEPGSNPVITVHVHPQAQNTEQKMGDDFVDQSRGATGAKAFGPRATALNTGDVAQALDSRQSLELATELDALKTMLAEVTLCDSAPLRETKALIDKAVLAAREPTPTRERVRVHWERAKTWISNALGAGVFLTSTAEKVRGIVERISACLS